MTSSIRDRRTVLRQTAGVLGTASTVGGLAGCLDDVPTLDPADTDDDGPTAAAEPMRTGMAIGMVFTGPGGFVASSEVDPDEPGGGRLVTIDAVDPGEEVTMSWRQTVERTRTRTEGTTVGVGDETPTPAVEVVEQTGTITARGLADAHATFLPMFWKPRETTTDTSAIWLSQEAFQELKETRQTTWSADVLTRITWVGKAVQERIQGAVEDVKDTEDIVLEAKPDFVAFDLTADGRTTTVQAIEAHDSFGNEYVILDNESNPLVVKFTYNAVSVGVTGFDTGLWSLIKAVFSGYQVVSLDAP